MDKTNFSRCLGINWVWIVFLFVGSISANEILINTRDGEVFLVDVDPTESLQDLQAKIALLGDVKESQIIIDLEKNSDLKSLALQHSRAQGQYLGYPRNYFADVTPTEKSDVHFIVSNLANKSLISIAFMKSELEEAGNRIDHIHPLRFLMTIFADEELKVLIRNIRARGRVWNHFIGGLKDSLTTETSLGNIKAEHVLHFSDELKVSSHIIADAIYMQLWDDFVDLLIAHIPRTGHHDRYDT